VERFFTAGIATEALRSSMVYCEHALRDVRKQPVSARDFSAVRTTGFHAYYKPVITLGRLLLERGTISEQPAPQSPRKPIVPYAIDMQLLFEMYLYAKLRTSARNSSRFVLENKFGEKRKTIDPYESGVHIQAHVIPDF